MSDIHERAKRFQALHNRDIPFVLPNPWDTGSAKMMTALGFEALATTSAGFAFATGRTADVGEVGREEALDYAAKIIAATPLPVSADLENGYGHSPEDVAQTIRQAAKIGLAGCTIEDTTGDPDNPIYERAHAIERIAAAAEVVAGLDRPFMLTARAENYLFNRPDFEDTLARLQGYEAVGADVLYAPGLPDLEAIAAVCKTVSKPVNVVAGIGLPGVTVEELQRAGVRRISVGSSFARVAYGAMIRSAKEIQETGSFASFENAAPFASINALIRAV